MQSNAGERLDINKLPVQPIQLMTDIFHALLVASISKFEQLLLLGSNLVAKVGQILAKASV